MKKIFYILVLVVSGFMLSLKPNAAEALGNCLGIFENKAVCEAKYRIERDLKVCRENSQDACRKYTNANKVQQYCTCLDNIRRSCMSKLNHYGLMDYSACDEGPE